MDWGSFETVYTLGALFVLEYALGQLLTFWGVSPRAMIGHSIGEYVAACLSGVFTLEEALELVAVRGYLIHEQIKEKGEMKAAYYPENGLIKNLSVNNAHYGYGF